MIVIETFIECRNANEARARERYWFEELSANMNSYIPIVVGDERREHILEIKKKYNETHKEQRKIYYEQNKEKMVEYFKNYRQVHDIEIKENKIKNSENHKLYMKEYYKTNKQKMLYDRRIDCRCTCGSHYFLYAKSSHEKTNKHIKFMNSQNVEI